MKRLFLIIDSGEFVRIIYRTTEPQKGKDFHSETVVEVTTISQPTRSFLDSQGEPEDVPELRYALYQIFIAVGLETGLVVGEAVAQSPEDPSGTLEKNFERIKGEKSDFTRFLNEVFTSLGLQEGLFD